MFWITQAGPHIGTERSAFVRVHLRRIAFADLVNRSTLALTASGRSSQQLPHVVAIAPGRGQAGAVGEDQDVVPLEPGLDLLYSIQVHNHGAADPDEPRRIQLLL